MSKDKCTKEKDPLDCPKSNCGGNLGDDNHKCDIIPIGNYVGDGSKLGNHILKHKKGEFLCYNGSFSNHPFYYPDPSKSGKNNRNGIEAHHLITSASVTKSPNHKLLIQSLGYSINHRNNGVLLPTIMQVACTYAVPLHNGNHSATFILDRNIWNDEKNEQAIKPIFKNYDTLDELLKLNYEKHVEDLVRNILEKYLLKDICKSNERLEVSKNFIKIMDKHSMIIFKRIITFCWTLTSDGLNYRSGGIGCCKCDTQKDKRKLIGSSLKNKIKLSYKSPKKFWGKILTSDELCKEISEKDFICKAGTKMDNHYRNNENIPFQERNNIKKFEGFN